MNVLNGTPSERLSAKLEELKLKKKEEEAQAKAQALGFLYINLKGFPISPEALTLIERDLATKLKVVCFYYNGPEFRLASPNPDDPRIQELLFQIAERKKSQGKIYLVSEASLQYALDLYSRLPKIREIVKGVEIKEEDLAKFTESFRSFQELQDRVKNLNISDLVTFIIAAALQTRSSDIHLEAEEKEGVVRFRIDGVLHQVISLPKENWPQIAARIKLISGLKINVVDRPQDGRFTIFLKTGKIDVRVSTIPTAFGESIVMRILKPVTTLALEDLGIRGSAFERLQREIARPNGMIITTGPTGSGKTTTLYAILNKLNTPETKIITLEDPIEYELKGIIQSQIDPSRDYTFAKGLRAILRQDPDVIMVGEIRDLETAEIAIQAALTGHLVLSTIHTNSAAGAIPRFLAMGAKGFLLAPALNAIIGQRLVRRICQHCKEEITLDNETLNRVREILSQIPPQAGYQFDLNNLKFFHGRGCEKCFGLGYYGRIGIYEIFSMNKEIENLILSGQISEYAIQEIAVKNGMITMVQDGLLKALDGITTVEEVFSVSE